MKLNEAQLARVAAGARQVPDGDGDSYFKHVADRLRPILQIADRDVHTAVADALTIYRRRQS